MGATGTCHDAQQQRVQSRLPSAMAAVDKPVEEVIAAFFHADAVHRELPNALFPDGVDRDLAGLDAAAEAGRKRIGVQSFEVLNAVAADGQVALEVSGSGTLAVPLGALPAGHVLRAHIATFLEFRDGKIAAQRNYDCYERLDPA